MDELAKQTIDMEVIGPPRFQMWSCYVTGHRGAKQLQQSSAVTSIASLLKPTGIRRNGAKQDTISYMILCKKMLSLHFHTTPS